MPLQTTFGSTVTKVETTQRHPLGTLRFEGNKIYKYVKAGGTIANKAACQYSAEGTVSLLSIYEGAGAGMNVTGTALSSGDYFWMQIAGEVTALDTSGITGVGYPVGITHADGVTLGNPTSHTIAWLGNSTCCVVDASAGVILLSGLIN